MGGGGGGGRGLRADGGGGAEEVPIVPQLKCKVLPVESGIISHTQ